MNTLAKSDINKLSKEELQKVMPIALTFDGEPIGLLVSPDEVIYIADMHPYVRKQFKAREAQVRAGMPNKGTRIVVGEPKKAVPPVEPIEKPVKESPKPVTEVMAGIQAQLEG